MTAITLEQIEERQSELAALIQKFKEQPVAKTIEIPAVSLQLNPGECWAGLVVVKNGEPSYHLILLPGQAEGVNWEDAKKWAEAQGGELPNRREQALLYANLKEEFDECWYWSSDRHASVSGYAWGQTFTNGTQGYYDASYEFRCRAVRRSFI